MKNTLGIAVILGLGTVLLTGCNTTPTENTPEEEVGIANPASAYCEEQGGTLEFQTDEGGEFGICNFDDGSSCEEWSYYRGECEKGDSLGYEESEGVEIDENYELDLGSSELFSEESLQSAVTKIMNEFNYNWEIKVDVKSLAYLGDELAKSELDYCKSLDETVDECVVFTSSFHTSEDSGVLEPDTDINDYTWYLGRPANGDWNILTRGFN